VVEEALTNAKVTTLPPVPCTTFSVFISLVPEKSCPLVRCVVLSLHGLAWRPRHIPASVCDIHASASVVSARTLEGPQLLEMCLRTVSLKSHRLFLQNTFRGVALPHHTQVLKVGAYTVVATSGVVTCAKGIGAPCGSGTRCCDDLACSPGVCAFSLTFLHRLPPTLAALKI
jgi:hypothetical protein